MNKWIIIEGMTADGKQKEFQVSDGEQGDRAISYDFLSYNDARECCDELNRIEKLEDDNPNSVGYYGYNQKTDNYYPNLDD